MAIGGKEFLMNYEDNPPSLRIDLLISSTSPKSNSICKLNSVLVDTGCDITFIPNKIIAELDLEYSGDETELCGFDDNPDRCLKLKLYYAKISVEGVEEDIILKVGGVDFEPLIGRDLINHWHILLNGENGDNGGTFEIADSDSFSLPNT